MIRFHIYFSLYITHWGIKSSYGEVQSPTNTRNEVFYLGLPKSVYFWPHLLPLWESLGIRKFSPQRNELNYNFVRQKCTWGFLQKNPIITNTNLFSTRNFFSPPEIGKLEFITSCTIAECMAFISKLQRSNTMWRLQLRCNCRRHHYHTQSSSEKLLLNKNYYELTSEASLRDKDYITLITLCWAELQLQRQRHCCNTLHLFMNSGKIAWRIS